jgi:hypothetical protein
MTHHVIRVFVLASKGPRFIATGDESQRDEEPVENVN